MNRKNEITNSLVSTVAKIQALVVNAIATLHKLYSIH